MTATTTRAAECWARILAQPDGYPMGIAADFARDDGAEPAEACAAVEAVAQQHLDDHPDDHRARRLLGEWLTWHGDRRGEGYAAMGACRKEPHCGIRKRLVWFNERFYATFAQGVVKSLCHCLPGDWYDAMRLPVVNWHDYDTRRAAENAAALAFARLPAERRAQLLKGEM